MASRESDFVARMVADAPLMAILTGGVATGEAVGLEGITRETRPASFSGGYLLPTALVRQAANIPTGEIDDYNDLTSSMRQRVEVWLYSEQGSWTAIDAAATRIRTLFQGHVFAGTFEIRLANVIDRQRDTGSLDGANLARLDWQVDSIIQ